MGRKSRGSSIILNLAQSVISLRELDIKVEDILGYVQLYNYKGRGAPGTLIDLLIFYL